MKYEGLITRAKGFPVFGDDIAAGAATSRSSLHLQLSRWVAKGKVIRLKRGLYTLPETYRKAPLSLRWLANTLYSPSYLSLEYMLSWYDMIPERVATITSVTLLKTALFNNPLGRFAYRTVKKDLFFGFEEIKDEFGAPILIASPEKAFLDYIYLSPEWENTEAYLEGSLRLQQLDQLEKRKFREYAVKFHSKKLDLAVETILKFRRAR